MGETNVFQIAAMTATFSGMVSISVALLIEKLGGKIGGILGGSPTVVVVAMLGLYYATANEDPQSVGEWEPFRKAAYGVPMGTCMSSLMFFVWRWGICYYDAASSGVMITTVIKVSLFAILFWISLTTISLILSQWVMIQTLGYDVAVPGLFFLFVNLISGIFQAFYLARPSPRSSAKSTPLILYLCRFTFSFIVVGSCIIVAEYASPLLSGVVSTFPAIFVTTTATTWYNSGADVILGAIGPLSLSVVSVALYGILSFYLFISFGPILGSIATYLLVTSCFTLPIALLLSLRSSVLVLEKIEENGDLEMEENISEQRSDEKTDEI